MNHREGRPAWRLPTGRLPTGRLPTGRLPASHLWVALGLGALALVTAPASAALISVDFGTQNTVFDPIPSPTTSGPEAAATSAQAGFGAANVWNAVAVGEYVAPATTNPSFSGLRDSTGAVTGVGLSLTGSVKGFSGFNNSSGDALRQDYLYFNSGNNRSTTLSWTLTGLVAGAAYDLFVYGSNAGNADWTMAVGLQQLLVDGLSGTAFFHSLVADASGTIRGSLLTTLYEDRPSRHEINWSGFQLLSTVADPVPDPTPVPNPAQVPEPAGLTLAGVALLGLALSRRRTHRPS